MGYQTRAEKLVPVSMGASGPSLNGFRYRLHNDIMLLSGVLLRLTTYQCR